MPCTVVPLQARKQFPKEIQREITQAVVLCNLVIIHPNQFFMKLLGFVLMLDSNKENTKKNHFMCSILKENYRYASKCIHKNEKII